MNRNVTIVIIILVLVVIAGYFVWLRSKYQTPVTPQVSETVSVSPTPSPEVMTASPSATPGAKEATGSTKTATSGAKAK